MGFLPSNYEPPAQGGNYMRLAEGKNKFRVLSQAVVGNVFWMSQGTTRKPVRRRVDEEIQASELGLDKHGQREKVKHFWAFAVWNYHASSVQILEITQSSIREGIQALCEDGDWGDPSGYDISVSKKGTGLETEYAVTPSNPSPTPKAILDAYAAAAPNLDALFTVADPFASGTAAAPQSAATPVTPTDARKAAWEALKATLPPNLSPDEQGRAWVAAIGKFYPGKKQSELTVADWLTIKNGVAGYAGEEVPDFDESLPV